MDKRKKKKDMIRIMVVLGFAMVCIILLYVYFDDIVGFIKAMHGIG